MSVALSPTQANVLAYMRSFFLENDQLPPMSCTKRHFGWKSNNMVLSYYMALIAKGQIERNSAGRFRFARP